MSEIYSMTGYGRGLIQNEDLRLKIEMRSVNSRYLDLNFRMPKILFPLEDKMRSRISRRLQRGKVDLFIELRLIGKEQGSLRVREGLLQQYLQIFDDLYIQGRLGSKPDPTSLAMLPDLFEIEEQSETSWLEEPVLLALEEALEGMRQMRRNEGEHLRSELHTKAKELKGKLAELHQMYPNILEQYREAMEQRVREILSREDLLSQERLEIELAIFAERKDIAEELSRIDSHLQQLFLILAEGGGVGRKLDFLAQELGREINTIGSKASGYAISNTVIDMKSLLEQIREQVQNLE